MIIFLLCTLHPLHCSFYCPYQHRHLGRNILRLQGLTGDVSSGDHDHLHHDNNGTDEMPRPEFWTAKKLVRYSRRKINQVPFTKILSQKPDGAKINLSLRLSV